MKRRINRWVFVQPYISNVYNYIPAFMVEWIYFQESNISLDGKPKFML
jgi:hypothetical protein